VIHASHELQLRVPVTYEFATEILQLTHALQLRFDCFVIRVSDELQ
jgi:hypothetical protein